MSTLDVLCEAWARIEDPEHWTRGAYARDQSGHPVFWDDSNARRWCVLGAMWAGQPGVDGCDQLTEASRQLYGMTALGANDRYGHRAVQRIYALAVAYAADEVQP